MAAIEHDPKRLIIHELPAAPKFIGREDELAALREFWNSDDSILSLIGLGGAGKTALASQFIQWVEKSDEPDCMVVWSFYDDPDANAFLEALYRYLTGDDKAEVKGSGWFHMLREQLSGNRRILLVLDGLERVQRPSTDASGIYGELEDPLLRGLLIRLASTKGRTKAVITSRFPVATIENYLGRGYRVLDVEQLPMHSVKELLSNRGIMMDDARLARFVGDFGSHALSLDLLAGAMSEFFGSDPDKLPAPPTTNDPAERLGYVLRLYEDNLPQTERDLLSRLCVFRFGVDSTTLDRIFLKSDNPSISGSLTGMPEAKLHESVERLANRHLVYRESQQRFTVHPAVRDYFYRLFRDPEAVHGAIAQHFSTLTERPGIGLPTEKEPLDLLEELIHHAIQAKSYDEAAEIYFSRMGGNDHLNGKLGEYARTYRMLTEFQTCPDPSAMYHCERAFGNLERALEWRPQNRYLLLIAGELASLSNDPSEPTRAMAQALMGKEAAIPERSPDMPICSAMAFLFRHDPDTARRVAELELTTSIYEDDRIRNHLALAEIFRETGRLNQAREQIEIASGWILQSASQEHLSSLCLARANLAIIEGQFDAAELALAEGLTICRESGFKLHECLFLTAQSRRYEILGRLEPAMVLARAAEDLSKECQFQYAEHAASHLLARIQQSMS